MVDEIEFLTREEINALYSPPHDPVVKSVKEFLTDFHIQYLRKATFFCLATGSSDGMECSPRGGDPGLVQVIDSKTVCFADWPGNNKIASLRNISEHESVAMLFIFPGLDVFMRINGRAGVTVDETTLDRLSEGSRRPKTAVVVRIDSVFYHCGKAINRAGLWKEESRIEKSSVPSPGVLMKELAKMEDVAPSELDRQYDEAMKQGLYEE